MIVDAHLHLPVGSGIESLGQARDRVVADMRKDGVAHAILIPDIELAREHFEDIDDMGHGEEGAIGIQI